MALVIFTIGVLLAGVYAQFCRQLWSMVKGDKWAEDAPHVAPDSGLFWYGEGNVCEKDGETALFDPNKPSVIYVHGFQPQTVIR